MSQSWKSSGVCAAGYITTVKQVEKEIRDMEKYLITIYGDVEAGAPELCLSDEDRQKKANAYLEEHGPYNGVYALNIDWEKRTFEIFSV